MIELRDSNDSWKFHISIAVEFVSVHDENDKFIKTIWSNPPDRYHAW